MPSIVATGSITIVDVLDGAKTGTLKLYRWAASTAPALPTKASTFNWTTGGYTYPAVGETADGWTATLPASSAPGQVLYSVEKPITDPTGSATSVSVPASFWTGTVARAVSSLSAVPLRCYSKASGSGLAPSGTATTADSSTYPTATSFGVTFLAAFTAAQPPLGDNETLWISDGTQNPLTGIVTWATPYIATFKVGSLSALTINTGALNVDNALTIGTQGSILGGQTGFNAGTGFFLGYAPADIYGGAGYRFSIGTGDPVATVNASTDSLTLANHGLQNGSYIGVIYISGNITGVSTLSDNPVFYTVIVVDGNTFKLSEDGGATAVSIGGTSGTVSLYLIGSTKKGLTYNGNTLDLTGSRIINAPYTSSNGEKAIQIADQTLTFTASTGAGGQYTSPIIMSSSGAVSSYPKSDYLLKTYSVAAQVSTGELAGFYFNTAGTSMFILRSSGATSALFQYSLATAWDTSTASYTGKTYTVGSQASNPAGLSFNATGTKLYVFNYAAATSRVFEYNLGIAWDLATTSYASVSLLVGAQVSGGINAYTWASSGTRLYVQDYYAIYQYNLSTAYSLATATYASKFSAPGTELAGHMSISGSGLLGVTYTQGLSSYRLSTVSDISTLQYTGSGTWQYALSSGIPNSLGLLFGNSGKMFFTTVGTSVLTIYLELPYDLRSAVLPVPPTSVARFAGTNMYGYAKRSGIIDIDASDIPANEAALRIWTDEPDFGTTGTETAHTKLRIITKIRETLTNRLSDAKNIHSSMVAGYGVVSTIDANGTAFSGSSGGALPTATLVNTSTGSVLTLSSSSTANATLVATNSGTSGVALQVAGRSILSTSSAASALSVTNNTAGALALEVAGLSSITGSGASAILSVTNSTAGSPALSISGRSTLSVASTSATISATNTGTGNAIFATAAGPSAAVYGETTGTGNYTVGVEGRISGNLGANNAYGVLGQITNASSGANTVGVYGKNSGSGIAVVGEAAGSGIGGVFTATSNVALEARGTLRSTGISLPTSGAGIELTYNGSIGYVVSYNRSTSTALPLHMISSETVLGGTTKVPATSTTAGVQGQIAWDTNFIYVCTATNVWRRAALSSW